MEIKIDTQVLLNRFLQNIRSEEAKQVVSRQLNKEKLIESQIHFGDWDNLTVSPNANNAEAIMRFTKSTSVELRSIQQSREKKAKISFQLSCLTFGIAIACIFTGLMAAFWQKQSNQLAIIPIVASLIIGFFGIILFKLYERENNDLKGVEAELVKIEKLEYFFEMASKFENPIMLDEAYKKLITQMET